MLQSRLTNDEQFSPLGMEGLYEDCRVYLGRGKIHVAMISSTRILSGTCCSLEPYGWIYRQTCLPWTWILCSLTVNSSYYGHCVFVYLYCISMLYSCFPMLCFVLCVQTDGQTCVTALYFYDELFVRCIFAFPCFALYFEYGLMNGCNCIVSLLWIVLYLCSVLLLFHTLPLYFVYGLMNGCVHCGLFIKPSVASCKH